MYKLGAEWFVTSSPRVLEVMPVCPKEFMRCVFARRVSMKTERPATHLEISKRF